jgi:serine/threonine protein phosphatase PrpC
VSALIEVSVESRSELGRRKSNEDRVGVCREGSRWVAILADGAGGHWGGAEASRRAVESIESSLCGGDPNFNSQSLTQAVLAAHDDIQGAHDNAHGIARMHSTIVALWIDCDSATALWSNVGDSRLYRVRAGQAVMLTSDDSVVQRLVDAGLITPEQADAHPQKNQLIAALGIEEPVDPHTVSSPQEVLEGDAFLLCSDGWWSAFDEASLARTLSSSATPSEWLTAMQLRIEEVAEPRQDNFSAIAVWISDVRETTLTMALP